VHEAFHFLPGNFNYQFSDLMTSPEVQIYRVSNTKCTEW